MNTRRGILVTAVILMLCEPGYSKALESNGSQPRFLLDLFQHMIEEATEEMSEGTFDCESAGIGFHPDPQDCTRFYWCLTHKLSCHKTCSLGLHFDPTFNFCNWPWALSTPCGSEEEGPPTCGMPAMRSLLRSQPGQAKVVGGHEALPGSWPWMVSIQFLDNDHLCGGTLISDRWVLSAAHCFFRDPNPQTYHAVLGEHSIQTAEPYEQRRSIAEIILHEDFDYENYRNDIALLRLADPATLNERVSPACLPEPDVTVRTGSYCVIAGWGATEEPETYYDVLSLLSDTLLEAEVPIVSRWTCDQQLPDYDVDQRTQVCAGYTEGGVDTCQGDSGGPLLCESRDGHWFPYGITSYGEGCAQPQTPAVYTKVPAMVDWIRAHIGDNSATYIGWQRAVPQADTV